MRKLLVLAIAGGLFGLGCDHVTTRHTTQRDTVPTTHPTKGTTEMPKHEPPKAEAPKTEVPKTEAPKTEAPKSETPKAGAPKSEPKPGSK